MKSKNKAADPARPTASKVSDTTSEQCDGLLPPDERTAQSQTALENLAKGEGYRLGPPVVWPQRSENENSSPQERKREKTVERTLELTGVEMSFVLAGRIDDALRTGLRVTDKEEEEAKGYPIYCCSEYHFARMTGPGSELVPLLYSVSLHLAADSGNFFVSLQDVAKCLNIKDGHSVYSAASLLVASGFWEATEKKLGAATHYRPLGHRDWAAKCGIEEWNDTQVGRYCTVKAEFPFIEKTREYLLGQKLHGITAEKFFTGVLKGWLKLGTVEELESWAKDFMRDDAGQGDGVPRRVRLGNHFRMCATRLG